jgi:hypothetical protein
MKLELATIAWLYAEQILVDAEHSNVLVIFDCCEAGSLCKSRSPARFEYLSACVAGAKTKPAGPNSFTKALIWSLRELKNHERGWHTTSELRDKVTHAPHFPKDQCPMIGQRFFRPDYIVLAPSSSVLDHAALQSREGFEDHKRPAIRREYLDLRFEFHDTVTDEVFKETGRQLRSLIDESKIKATHITFIEKRGGSRWGPALHAVRAAVRLQGSKHLPNGHYSSHTDFNGIGDQGEPLAYSVNSQLPTHASSLGRATISSTPASRPQSPPKVNGLFRSLDGPQSDLGRYRLVS